jgi:hypothetical protein
VVAAFDVVHIEAAALEGAQHIETRARRQPPAHTMVSLTLTGSVRGAAGASLSGDREAVLLEALEVALDRLGSHRLSFLDGLAVGHKTRQRRARHGGT